MEHKAFDITMGMTRLVIRPSNVGINLISFSFFSFQPCLFENEAECCAHLALVLPFVCVTLVFFARVPRIRTFDQEAVYTAGRQVGVHSYSLFP